MLQSRLFFNESCHVPFFSTTLPLNNALVADLLNRTDRERWRSLENNSCDRGLGSKVRPVHAELD